MARRGAEAVWRGTTYRVPVPKTRAPFVNTPLLSLGPDARGAERFWISTYQSDGGCLGVLIDEWGRHRIVRFDRKQHGCYSAVRDEGDGLWLCGNLDRIVRLDLRRLTLRGYPTGAPSALVFQGMAWDRATGKLFAAAFPGEETTAVSFDTRRKKTVRLHRGFTGLHYMRCAFPNGDGTYSVLMHTPGVGLVRWDPAAETVETVFESLETSLESTYSLVTDEAGRRYVPSLGWYEPARGTFVRADPPPEREMSWFAVRRGKVYGAASQAENLVVGCWDFATGAVRDVLRIPDCPRHNVNLSASGKLVAVTLYGVFLRWDAEGGALETSHVLRADVVNHTDRVCRLDGDRILGTPFISQRFWTAPVRGGPASDCGRAAPGFGEILAVWAVRGKAYMAAYTGGELMEFDPRRPARYPENPRVVARPPQSLRPIADARDARRIYYACSAPYGSLGGTLTRYDTVTGAAAYALDPLPGQAISSLYCDAVRRALLAGTTPHADCRSCPPSADRSLLALIDADRLAVVASAPAPAGVQTARVVGPLDRRRFLCTGQPAYNLINDRGACWFPVDPDDLGAAEAEAMRPFPPGFRRILYAGRAGLFVLHVGARLELWDLRAGRRLRRLAERFNGYSFTVQDRSVYLLLPREVRILENCLADL